MRKIGSGIPVGTHDNLEYLGSSGFRVNFRQWVPGRDLKAGSSGFRVRTQKVGSSGLRVPTKIFFCADENEMLYSTLER